MTKAVLFTLLLLLTGFALAGKIRSDRHRLRALTPQEGRIRMSDFWNWGGLGFASLAQVMSIFAWISSDDRPPPILALVLLACLAALASFMVISQGPVRWSPEGMSGPSDTPHDTLSRTTIGWQEIARVTRRRVGRFWNSPQGWTIESADGRRIAFSARFPGHETALTALRHYRPDLDPGTLTP